MYIKNKLQKCYYVSLYTLENYKISDVIGRRNAFVKEVAQADSITERA